MRPVRALEVRYGVERNQPRRATATGEFRDARVACLQIELDGGLRARCERVRHRATDDAAGGHDEHRCSGVEPLAGLGNSGRDALAELPPGLAAGDRLLVSRPLVQSLADGQEIRAPVTTRTERAIVAPVKGAEDAGGVVFIETRIGDRQWCTRQSFDDGGECRSLAIEAAGDEAGKLDASRGEMLAEPQRLLDSEPGYGVVVAGEVRLRVTYEIQVGHVGMWRGRPTQSNLSAPAACGPKHERTVSGTSARFEASGVVTLITDFGLRDPFVGVMKGQLLRRHPAVRIVDLTHEIVPHWPAEAGFWLARSFRYFPVGTVHVAVVDPGVGGSRAIALVECEGHAFLAPDNGLLANVIETASEVTLRRLDAAALEPLALALPSATFHGRDIFAPVAAELAAGRVQPADLGPAVSDLIPGWLDEPVVGLGQVTGSVVTVDHFGNLITNIEAAHLETIPHPMVRVAGRELPLRRTYSDVRPGEYLALVNSFGVIEIARAEQSAADGLGLDRGAPVTVFQK
jgi:S-adenosylmethionine hydrolase